jgi:hypothetical protein
MVPASGLRNRSKAGNESPTRSAQPAADDLRALTHRPGRPPESAQRRPARLVLRHHGPGSGHTYGGKQPYTQARALRVDEIPAILEDYRRRARNAMSAGVSKASRSMARTDT